MNSKRKYMIRCDMEGASGVVSYEQAEPGKHEYPFGLRMFKSDLLACVSGLLAGGADEIVIYDEHYYGRNIDPEWLPDKVLFIAGKPPYRVDWAGGLDASFSGVILLGFHSKAAVPPSQIDGWRSAVNIGNFYAKLAYVLTERKTT